MSFKTSEFERQVASVFQADARYVERNRHTPEHGVTEFDALVYDFIVSPPRSLLCECKHGSAAYHEVLYLRGRQHLVGANGGVLVTRSRPRADALFAEVCARLGVSAVGGRTTAEIAEQLVRRALLDEYRAPLADHWIVYYRLEDSFKAILAKESNAHPATPVNAAYSYLNGLDVDMWWRFNSPWDRARFSYDLHERHRMVAAEVAEQFMAAGSANCTRYEHTKAVYARGKCPPAQAAMYVQMRARLTAAFLACECARDLLTGPPERLEAFRQRHLPDAVRDSPEFVDIPPNFGNSVATLLNEPDLASRLPVFLQTWFYGWGAFLRIAARDEEQEAIAADARDDVANIPRYFDLLTRLFAAWDRNWLTRLDLGSGILTFNLAPEPFKGVGIERRLALGLLREQELEAYEARWREWVPKYAALLRSAEDGEDHDWRTIERRRGPGRA